MNMKTFFTSIFLSAGLSAYGQRHDLSKANSGYLLTHSDSLYGAITVDIESNTLLLKSKKGIQNYSAKQVKKAVFFNKAGDFKIIVSGRWGSKQEATFFEAIVGGDTPLLYREGVKFDQYDTDIFSPFFTLRGESVFSLGNKKAILGLFKNRNEVSEFVKKNKLKIKIREDLVLLFCHVNGIEPIGVSSIAGDDI